MIRLSKLDGTSVAVNLEAIKYLESVPDTLIFFLNGDSLIVRESLDDIMEKVIAHKAAILEALAKGAPQTGVGARAPLVHGFPPAGEPITS